MKVREELMIEDRMDNWNSIINLQPLDTRPFELQTKSPLFMEMEKSSESSEESSFKTDEEEKSDYEGDLNRSRA